MVSWLFSPLLEVASFQFSVFRDLVGAWWFVGIAETPF
jgi:hypothetical protein